MIVKERNVSDILTRSKLPDADYVINPYIGCANRCMYCYAEFMKRFVHMQEDWGEFIIVKNWEKKIDLNKISGKKVLISSVTDPYNKWEEKFRKTEQILNELKDTTARIEVLTKSTLLMRDLDLLKKINNLRIGVSLGIMDESLCKILEPGASTVQERLKMIDTLSRHGFKVYIFLSPYFPGISDYRKCADVLGNKVESYAFENLNLRGGYKYRILDFIKNQLNHLYSIYVDIYLNKNLNYWYKLENEIIAFMKSRQYNFRMYFYHEKIKKK